MLPSPAKLLDNQVFRVSFLVEILRSCHKPSYRSKFCWRTCWVWPVLLGKIFLLSSPGTGSWSEEGWPMTWLHRWL